MLRLQLLPDYVFEGARIRKAIMVCTALFVLDVGATHLYQAITKGRLANMTNQAEVAKGFEGQIKAIEGEIGAVTAEIQPIDDKRNYMIDLKDFSDQYVAKLRALIPFIYRRVEVLSASITNTGFTLQVRTKTTDDVARMLKNLKEAYNSGLLQPDSINITGLTGWPNPTSSLSWRIDTAENVLTPIGDIGGLSAVGSQGAAPGGGGQAAGQPGGDAGAPPPEAGAPPGDPGAAPGGAPGGEAGGGGGQPASGAGAAEAVARARYLKPSVDPPPQPYLNMTITGNWVEPLKEPAGGAPGAAPGGAPGMPGDPGAGPPPGDPGAGPPPGGGEPPPPADAPAPE